MKRCTTTILLLTVMTGGCDLPPDASEAIGMDTDSSTWNETDTESDSTKDFVDSDDEEPGGMSCIQGVMCMIDTPGDSGACMEEMDPETRDAATAVGICVFSSCLDSLEDIGELMTCLMINCAEETLACVAGGLGDLSL